MKLSIKFKRFIPKVVLIFSKMKHYKDLFPENIIAKVEETLALIHYTGISTVLFCGNDLWYFLIITKSYKNYANIKIFKQFKTKRLNGRLILKRGLE